MADIILTVDVTSLVDAKKKLKDFQTATNNFTVNQLASGIKSLQNNIKQLVDAQRDGTIGSTAYNKGLLELKRSYMALGYSSDEARKAVRAYAQQLKNQSAAQDAAAAAQKAAAATQQFIDAQRKISSEIINGNANLNRISASYQTLSEKLRANTVTAQQHAAAEMALARELATVNGYLKANGALNTQKALAELRAAQATREAAAADAAAAATKARLTQSYNQLLASLNPVVAAQQRTRQTIDMLRAAVAAGAITTQQAAQALLQYRAALRAMSAANQQAALGMNRTAVLTQQAGYQFGDFFVQIQSGTNVLVAFGQQATQLIGTMAMLSNSTRMIAIFSGLGVLVAIGTAIGAAMMRASAASNDLNQNLTETKSFSDTIYEKFGFLEGSVRKLAESFGVAGGIILNILSTVARNLDVFITILGVTAVAAMARFIASTAAMGTLLTATQLLFSGMAGAQLVAASATTALTTAMSRLMVVISAHPIIAAMTAALVAAVFVLYRARDASSQYKTSIVGLSDALKVLRERAREANIETARIQLGADTSDQALALQRIVELNALIARQQELVDNSYDIDSINKDRLDKLIAEREEIERLVEADKERIRNMQRLAAKSDLDAIISSYDEQYSIQVQIKDAQDKLNEAVRLGLIDQETMVSIMAKYSAEISKSEDKAKGLADALKDAASAMASLLNMGSLEAKLAGLVAEVNAIETGANRVAAGYVASERTKAAQQRDEALAAGGIPQSLVNKAYADRVALIDQIGKKTTERDAALEAQRGAGRKGYSGSSGSRSEGQMESFIQGLMTERETLESWRSEQLDLLQQYNDTELAIIGGQAEAKFRIEQEYSSRLVQLKQQESELVRSSAKGMYGELVGLLDMFAGESKAAAIASIALTKGLRIAEVITSGAAAQVRALAELGPILGPPAAAKIAGFTKIQAGIIAATGLVQAASVGRGSSGSLGGGNSPSGSDAAISGNTAAAPQRVIIEGIDRNSLITGEQLSNIFEALYKENENRGFVFEVAR